MQDHWQKKHTILRLYGIFFFYYFLCGSSFKFSFDVKLNKSITKKIFKTTSKELSPYQYMNLNYLFIFNT